MSATISGKPKDLQMQGIKPMNLQPPSLLGTKRSSPDTEYPLS